MARVPFGLLTTAVAAATFALARPAAAQQAAPVKIAFIDARAVLRSTPGYVAAESTFNREVQAFRDEVQRLQAAFDSAVSLFDQQSIALSPTARQSKQRELRDLQQQLEQRSGQLQDRANQREQELISPIQTRVSQVIQGIRAEGNYSVLIDVNAPGILAYDPALDLTTRVIDRLRVAR